MEAQGREALDGWLEVGCALGELSKTTQGYGLRGYLARRLAMAENDDVARRFLDAHDDAIEDVVLPNNNIRDLMRKKACGYQVLPGTADMDGFYYACFIKKDS